MGLFLRLVFALVYVPTMVASDASARSLGEGQFKLVYCSLLGSMAVPESGSLDSETPNDTPFNPDFNGCPLCQAISATAFVISPDNYGLSQPPILLGKRGFLSHQPHISGHRIRNSARDPPHFI